VGGIELMRQYQKETAAKSKQMAEEWKHIIDKFLSDWKEDGINGSAPFLASELRHKAAIKMP
jgi:hypothetical protein